ncbi:type II toxin-antitoxin system PemK/MazF family toxin [Candidatus Thioglobus sp.]|uniref:type II toxin-antitoxin system PemK/MazF family toxin n=1 Tax=Candidatus Thioglobus sp. TaxID=2026721 RepID=UPI003D12EB68
MNLNQGDIYLVNFDPVKKGEMGKLRPAIILSDNQDSTLFATVVVMPLSSIVIKDNMPYRYTISKRAKLKKDSDACIYEIRSLSKSRVKEKIASIDTNELNDIRQALHSLL